LTIHARISGLGKYVPERILTNADLERMVETSDTWIRERTGVQERRIAADDETCSTLSYRAGLQALDQARVAPEELDLIIVATCSPDGMLPSVASYVQEQLGARHAMAFDINATCVGFLTALATATQFIENGTYQKILVIGAEVLSRIIDWTDRGTCVLFGDGAGAVVLETSDRGGPLSFVLHSDGTQARALYAHGPAARPRDGGSKALSDHPVSRDGGCYFVQMDGKAIFKFAVQAMEQATREALAGAHLAVDDIDLLVPHQANLRIIEATAKRLNLPMERAMVNLDRYGNTSAASIPMALREAFDEGRLHDGDRIVLVAFGGGLVWGAMVVDWTLLGPARLAEAAHAATRG
jgi:3-oxoacyl-[acyl-carrier-protein] synthase-3